MPRMIRVSIGHTSHFVDFVVMAQICTELPRFKNYTSWHEICSHKAKACARLEISGTAAYGKLILKMTNFNRKIMVQSTLVISKSKGPSEILPDIRTSTYQIYSIEEETIRTTKFLK